MLAVIMRSPRLAFRLSLLSVRCLQLFARSPPITVSIHATWQEPPLLIQVLEAAALERPDSFFLILNAVCSSWTPELTELSTDRQIYQHLTQVLRSPGLLDRPGEFESLEASIALKEAHPKIEAFRAWSALVSSNSSRDITSDTGQAGEGNTCDTWAIIKGHKACTPSRLTELISRNASDHSPAETQPLPFDHVNGPVFTKSSLVVVLYASADPRSFGPFHQILFKAAQEAAPGLTYIFRWNLPAKSEAPSSASSFAYLSGWSAGLDIKKSEYLTLDDRPVDSTADDQAQPGSSSSHKPDLIQEENTKLPSLKSSEILDIGLKATQHILSSKKPLSALRHLTENFPQHAYTLVTRWVPNSINPELRNELEQNAEDGLKPGRSAVWLNGLDLSSFGSLESWNFFQLIEIMRSERHWITGLSSLGLSFLEARSLIADEEINRAMNPDSALNSDGIQMDPSILGERFDASDRPEGGGAIIWLNDLEKDSRYAGWPTNLRYILRPTFPGQLHALSRNLINVVLCINMTQTESLKPLGDVIEPFISRSLPIRWGLIPLIHPDSLAEEILPRALWNLTQSVGPIETLNFIKKFAYSSDSELVNTQEFSRQARELISDAAEHLEVEEGENTQALDEEKFKGWLNKTKRYVSRLALCSSDDSIPACMFINGRFFAMDEDFRSHLQQTASLQTQFLQHQIYFDLLTDDADVANYLYDLPNVHPARNDFVFPSESRPLRFVNLLDASAPSWAGPAEILFENAALPQRDDQVSRAVVWLTGDLDSDAGAAAVAAALGLLARPPPEVFVQVAFVPVQNEMDPRKQTEVSRTLANLMTSTTYKSSCHEILTILSRRGFPASNFKADQTQAEIDPTKLTLVKTSSSPLTDSDTLDTRLRKSKEFFEKLGVKSDQLTIVMNGRVLTPSPDQRLGEADLRLLVEFETQKRTLPLRNALRRLAPQNLDAQWSKLPFIASLIGFVFTGTDDGLMQSPSKSRSLAYRSRRGHNSSITFGNEEALFELGVILDPSSETAQRWSAFLEVLSQRPDILMKVWLNPAHVVNELPIKRFFRSALADRPQFDEEGNMLDPGVSFLDIPSDVLLTLAIDTPPAWLALPKDSVHDLDNIMLSELPIGYSSHGVDAVFQLEHIIIAGHAREIPSGHPPRGLQVVLTDVLRGCEVDTIIMANLGYFQFKSAPGLHRLSIRSGRSSELYVLESLDASETKAIATASSTHQNPDHIYLTTFNGLTLFPRFRKRVGREEDSLIQPITVDSSSPGPSAGAASDLTKLIGQFKDIASGMLGNKGADNSLAPSAQVINIFTVASGLLYERMAYLMCVSVMRHTSSKVKFWFISNFLSPSFKRFIPHLAKEYGFDYQLVTYRWPPWLRAQKEKQRVIWGYKILFLDVLFPLELDRVIFVDSDQIVRTDLKALVELDLQGAPYAYTPMCNDRNETKGFRFWDAGYWKESLQGRPYHISALYVVDLRVFRAIAAGDQLRQHYQALSADPGSLANLDQDLPNNMQNILPIFSLDQSWLWCETWCSDEGLKVAKTIDLCNNPLTHEPKLMRARRLIPEWDVYDQEVARLAAKVKRESTDETEVHINVQAGEKVVIDSHKAHIEAEDPKEGHAKDEL